MFKLSFFYTMFLILSLTIAYAIESISPIAFWLLTLYVLTTFTIAYEKFLKK